MSIYFDMTGASAKLARLEKQANYAGILSANDGAIKGAQPSLRATYADTFTLRGTQGFFERDGAKLLQRATKANPVAIVGASDRAKFLNKFVMGGTFGPADNKGKLAIPTGNVRRNKKEQVTASQRPRALIGKGAFFAGPKSGTSFLVKMAGRGKAKTLSVLYLLVGRVRVAPTLRPGLAKAERAALAAAMAAFPKRLKEALETAR